MHADICACAHPHTRACTIFRQRKQDITKFVCLLTSVFVFLRVHCYPYFSVPLQNFQNTFAFQNAGAGWGSNILQCHCSHLSNYSFFIACLMCWPYHPFFYSISRQISTVLSGVCSVVWWLVRIKTELTITRRTYVLDKGCLFSVDMVVCVWWRMLAVAVKNTSCCCFYCLTVCVCVLQRVTEQKVTSWLCGCTWVPTMFQSHKWGIAKNADSHLHNTQEVNTFTPPRCSLFVSLSVSLILPCLAWWESCYHWRRACS